MVARVTLKIIFYIVRIFLIIASLEYSLITLKVRNISLQILIVITFMTIKEQGSSYVEFVDIFSLLSLKNESKL
jgi:hypothetical protein